MSSLCVCNECNFYILWKRSSPKCYSPFVLSGLLMLLYQCPYYFHSVPRAPTSSRSWNAIHPFNKEKSWVLPFSIRKYVFNYLYWDIADWSRWMKAEMRNYCSYFEKNSKHEDNILCANQRIVSPLGYEMTDCWLSFLLSHQYVCTQCVWPLKS